MPYTAAAETPPEQVAPYGPLPGPPRQPQPAYRPDDWPTSTVSDQGGSGTPSRGDPNAAPQGQMLETSAPLQPLNDVQVLATVWSDPILASDVLPYVNDIFAANKDQYPPEQHEKLRNMLIKQRMSKLIDTKTILNDAKRTIPAENIKNVETKIFEAFEKSELPKMVAKAGCANRAELDAKLRTVGSSVDREKQSFFETTLAQQWLLEQVRREKEAEVTHEEMLAWYREHIAEYESPPKARWQQLTVRAGQMREKGEAYRRIAGLGNMVLDGVPLAEVAKKHSEGVTAADGGVRDWTTKGSLVSKPLDQALFSVPVGKLSDIIEDEQGFHIIIVLERVDTTRVPFTQAQTEIKEKIKKQRQNEAVAKYLAKVKEQTPVWTIFDSQEKQLTERPGTQQR
jgi:parvulin-like peptidyl-prolyl isomerase